MTKLEILIEAAYPVIYVATPEEERLFQELARITDLSGLDLFFWDISAGFRKYKDGDFTIISEEKDPNIAIHENFINAKVNGLLVLPDIHRLFHDAATVRLIRNLLHLRHLDGVKITLMSSPSIDLPVELRRQVATVDFPLPTRSEIKGFLSEQQSDIPKSLFPKKEGFAEVVDSCRGLTMLEIENVLANCIAENQPLESRRVIQEKKEILRGSRSLEYIETPLTLHTDVGGLENVISWLEIRRKAFTEEAVAFGIPAPKGLLLIGHPGTGKSLVALAVGGSYGFPIIRFNMGAAFSKWQGESEAEIRNAWDTAVACAPCILVMDEIDKATGGLGGDGDNGTGNRILGDLLTKMSENNHGVVVVATCNDVKSMPAAMLRKGRFDEIIFVDLPGPKAVAQILNIHLGKKKQAALSTFEDQDKIIEHMLGMTGAEIEQTVIDSMYLAFNESRKLTAADLIEAATKTRPYCVLKEEEVTWMRKWAENRAVPASSEVLDLARVLDLRKRLGQAPQADSPMSTVKRLRARRP